MLELFKIKEGFSLDVGDPSWFIGCVSGLRKPDRSHHLNYNCNSDFNYNCNPIPFAAAIAVLVAECGPAQQRFKGVRITKSINMAFESVFQKCQAEMDLIRDRGVGPYLMVNDRGSVTVPIHEAEETTTVVERLDQMKEWASPFPAIHVLDPYTKAAMDLIRDRDVGPYLMVNDRGSVTVPIHEAEETTTVVERLDQMKEWVLPFPAIHVHDPCTKIKATMDLIRDGGVGPYLMVNDRGFVTVPIHEVEETTTAVERRYQMKEWALQAEMDLIRDRGVGPYLMVNDHGSVTGHPSFVMPCSLVIAQLDLWNEKSGKYEEKVYVLHKHLDEKLDALNLQKLGATPTKLFAEQAAHINVPIECLTSLPTTDTEPLSGTNFSCFESLRKLFTV